jgi:hypothetical protein
MGVAFGRGVDVLRAMISVSGNAKLDFGRIARRKVQSIGGTSGIREPNALRIPHWHKARGNTAREPDWEN